MRHVNSSVRGFLRMKNFTFILLFMTFTGSRASSIDSVDNHDSIHSHGENGEVVTGHDHPEGGTHEEEGLTTANMSSTILHHISDAHEWHFFTVGETHVSLPLPVILYSK